MGLSDCRYCCDRTDLDRAYLRDSVAGVPGIRALLHVAVFRCDQCFNLDVKADWLRYAFRCTGVHYNLRCPGWLVPTSGGLRLVSTAQRFDSGQASALHSGPLSLDNVADAYTCPCAAACSRSEVACATSAVPLSSLRASIHKQSSTICRNAGRRRSQQLNVTTVRVRDFAPHSIL